MSEPKMFVIPDDCKYFSPRFVFVKGPLIIGAGPSGLAVAAGLMEQGVPHVILERANCIAPLWQHRTYDRLKLTIPKKLCQLPKMPFPDHCPEYPNRRQLIDYLKSYARRFDINPRFNECVQSAEYDEACDLWKVKTVGTNGFEVEYICRFLVVATGENAERVVPEIDGLEDFGGEIIHVREYKSGATYRGKKVLVVGCGNSGMDVSLDLCNHDANPSMVVRNSFYREVLLKNNQGMTPVLDIGALEKIRSGEIRLVPGIKRFSCGMVELVNGQKLEIDSVVLATGYSSNVSSWLQETEFFDKNGFPKTPFPNGWKGKAGLYAVGFTMRGLPGLSLDAVKISQDIGEVWKHETKKKRLKVPTRRRCISTF